MTSNALGEGGLREAVVCLPPGAFEIQRFLGSLRMVSDFAAKLKWLHREHVAFMQRNPPSHPLRAARIPLPSFREWLVTGEGRAEWRMGWYEDDVDAPGDVVKVRERETGSKDYSTFLGVARARYFQSGVFTLSFRVSQKKKGELELREFEWWLPVVSLRSKSKEFKDYPNIWFPRGRRIPHGTRPPFDHRDVRFRKALSAAIVDSGGLDWLRQASLRPSRTFLKNLAGHGSYGAQPRSRNRTLGERSAFV
ncbi:MAG: hypothetical protein ABI665_06420 [Vicinamibacterales bacterium]